MQPQYDVGIVGYGPVGATLANLLGTAGLSVAIFEREPSVYHAPRAAHFDDEAMRVFQAVGLADEVRAGTHVNVGMRFVNAAGELLIDWPRPQEVSRQGWHPSYRFHQPALETALRQGVARFERHRVHLRADVFALDEAADHVAIRWEDLGSGALQRATCRYVVGCDGARSTVRRFMGTSLEDMRSHERWLVLDMIMKRPTPHLSDWTIQLCDPARPCTIIRMVGERRRWEIMLMPGDDPATIARPERVWALLAPWITAEDAEVERAVVYTFHSVIAEGWRRGRMMLAGDAAHQTPPFLGQGMCAGIRDAANLAWKLAAVVTGAAPDSLLDSYEAERSPHVREFIALAVRLGGVIQATDPDVAARRDRDMAANPEFMVSIAPRLGPGLHDGMPPPAGTIASQPRLADGRRLDDAVGLRFAVLGERALLAKVSAETAAGWRRADVAVLPDEGRDELQRLGAGAVVIRPDRYILGVASSPAELDAVSARIPLVGRDGQ